MSETTAAPPAWSRTFPATPAQAREARGFLTGVLHGHPVTDDAVLCLSELVANAAIHSDSRRSGGHFTVRAELRGDCLRVEVTDEGGSWEWPAVPGRAARARAVDRRPAGPHLGPHRRQRRLDRLVRAGLRAAAAVR